MNLYRSHFCSELSKENLGDIATLSGWIDTIRDHGNLLFIDLRDNYGITQCVVDAKKTIFKEISLLNHETVIKISGRVIERAKESINKNLLTGDIEIDIISFEILSNSQVLPLPVNSDIDYGEEVRLKYRYLDLRRNKLHKNILLRNKVISSIRKKMTDIGFTEFQTPILTSSSPEGARDYLVPSRIHQGKFYALPQAPQQFKQLLMIAGFDKYFQIAPCFRDEDSRADRSPGEFYQLDFEMSFVDQEDVFKTIEPVLFEIFDENKSFNKDEPSAINNYPFPRIPYNESLEKYGTDKPDLRNPLTIKDYSKIFSNSDFKIFSDKVAKGNVVKGIIINNTSDKPRSFYDKLNNWAREEGAPGLGYISYNELNFKGPIAKNLSDEKLNNLNLKEGDSIFFVCDNLKQAQLFSGKVRDKLCLEMDILEKNSFKFCWIVDFPMYEIDEKTNKLQFSHNPFSMPQGEMDSLINQNPLDIKAFQYDIVCNGIELSSGAIRNHIPELMYKLFSVAGYTEKKVNEKFSGMINALSYGAPPHGGIAPGIDRIVMLLAGKENIREVTLFPMNQNAQDLMMQAPSEVDENQLQELNIKKIIKKN